MLDTVSTLLERGTDVIDLKVADTALAEMAEAFGVFQPLRQRMKVTIFGSARTEADHPAYRQARALAAAISGAGWMVVTGAGPGIMAAGMEGAGRDQSVGVNIRLPHEQGANQFIAQDPKLVEMRYFFTRKLMLLKESDGFIVLPGGFGTLDEGFELLTLLQTGKAEPAPVVLLDVPGGSFWHGWSRFLADEVEPRGLVSDDDRAFFTITDDVARATAELLGFYRNYRSCRWVGDLLVLRMAVAPDREQLADLKRRFGDIVTSGAIRRVDPFRPSGPTTTSWTCPGWRCGSTRCTTDACASSSTRSTPWSTPDHRRAAAVRRWSAGRHPGAPQAEAVVLTDRWRVVGLDGGEFVAAVEPGQGWQVLGLDAGVADECGRDAVGEPPGLVQAEGVRAPVLCVVGVVLHCSSLPGIHVEVMHRSSRTSHVHLNDTLTPRPLVSSVERLSHPLPRRPRRRRRTPIGPRAGPPRPRG